MASPEEGGRGGAGVGPGWGDGGPGVHVGSSAPNPYYASAPTPGMLNNNLVVSLQCSLSRC